MYDYIPLKDREPVDYHGGEQFEPGLGVTYHHGTSAKMAVERLLATSPTQVACDIETAGLGALAFMVKCVTFAWNDDDGCTHSAILDPRDDTDRAWIRDVTDHAAELVFHNAPYDIPPMVHHGLMQLDSVDKVHDTLVTARMTFPDRSVGKSLTALACRQDLLGVDEPEMTMNDVFRINGYRNSRDGWYHMDIDNFVYRMGAMADTVITLRLVEPLKEKCVTWLTGAPFESPTKPDRAGALDLLAREQRTNQIMLKVNARGLLVDTDYLGEYSSANQGELDTYTRSLVGADLDPHAGNLGVKILEQLDARGQLPSDWPRTSTGRLKADRKAMKKLADHPLVQAQQRVSELDKVTRYLEKVSGYSEITGRCHPQCAVLGASATGRMSYSEPELQQFPGDARPILIPDRGSDWTSLDWSSIEPVVVANSAGDREFLDGFNEHGADLYAPIVEQAGVTRKVAKVVLLAAMYGQGIRLLASNIGASEDEARQVQERVFSAMPKTKMFLDNLRSAGDHYGSIITADGRHLAIPPRPEGGGFMGYKATNYYTQGSAYSVLSDSINRVDKAGLGDSIKLAMHDELVVDSEAAKDVQAIMETPPDWLNEFCGHDVILRTDSNPLNGSWKYV